MNNEELIGRIKKLRHDFHLSVIHQVKSLGICNAQNIVEDFKRWYLFDFHNVETSRAFDIKQLTFASEHIESIDLNTAVSGMQLKYSKYESTKDLMKCTQGQISKIYAVAIGKLKMQRKGMYIYIGNTLNRKTVAFNITINEADKVIKRLEKYEANVYMRQRSEKKKAS